MMDLDQQPAQHYSVDGSIDTSATTTTTNGLKKSNSDSIWFDLKPDRSLLDSNFEGYKLSLDSFVQYKLDLSQETKLDTYNFIEGETSSSSMTIDSSKHKFFLYQHLKIFGMQNLLVVNHFDDSNVYYFDVNHRLVKVVYPNNKIASLPASKAIVPTNFSLAAVNPERTNITMRFVSETNAVVFDGYNTLYIIQHDRSNLTSDPCVSEKWNLLYKWQTNDTEVTSILKDAVLFENNYHVLLVNVQEIASQEASSSEKFNTVVNWLTIENSPSDNSWQVRRVRKLNCFNAVPDYVAIETNGQSLYVAGPEFIKFSYDSENGNNLLTKKYQSDVSMRPVESELNLNEKFYSWGQTPEEINVNVRLNFNTTTETKINKSDLKVSLKPDYFEILYLNKPVLNGFLSSTIKVDESTWTLNNTSQPNVVDLVLTKAKSGEAWTSLLRDQDKFGDYVLSDEQKRTLEALQCQAAESAKANECKSLFTLEQQLEECDGIVDDQAMANVENEENFLMLRRLDGNSHQATHKSYINENKFLFDVRVCPSQMPALCLRHDVDGVLWQPHRASSMSQSEWLTHDHSFLAFGYVQASKQETKFRSSSPDSSYVCIADARKHIYVYKQDSEQVETQLKNRKTGKMVSHVAKQFLISLDSDQEIYGIYCANDYLIVLLSDQCYLYKVNANSK